MHTHLYGILHKLELSKQALQSSLASIQAASGKTSVAWIEASVCMYAYVSTVDSCLLVFFDFAYSKLEAVFF